ncbi:MAG: DUF2939 domain-containing protein [Candidatus Binataceae bacterium]|nr:DUF2939 domain-containing protein [Candidatus Binataceae bacterium]
MTVTAIRVAVLLVIAAAAAWYWASPFFAVAGLRNAALHKDATELEKRVDFPRLSRFSG